MNTFRNNLKLELANQFAWSCIEGGILLYLFLTSNHQAVNIVVSLFYLRNARRDEGTKKVPKVRANISEHKKICMDTYLSNTFIIIPKWLNVRTTNEGISSVTLCLTFFYLPPIKHSGLVQKHGLEPQGLGLESTRDAGDFLGPALPRSNIYPPVAQGWLARSPLKRHPRSANSEPRL